MRHGSTLRSIVLPLLLAASAAPGGAGGQSSPLRGVVHAPDGSPIAGANVFILETLDGVLTGANGRFTIPAATAASLTLVVKRLGFAVVQRTVAPSERDSIDVTLVPGSVALTPITVQAGSYTAGDERGATLTPLEVVTTPGATADINRTIQGLPGVQAVDEGTALFVRGGDYTETKIFLNDAPLLNTVQLLAPTGTFVGTVDPFLLDGIFFSSGGFGARYGDALSGVAGLRTRGIAQHTTATASAGLAALSADGGVPLSRTLTVRAAANRFDLRPFLRVNGSTRDYDPAPRGRDLTGSAVWDYRPGAELKLFSADQTNALGVGVDDPAFSGSYNFDLHSRHTVLNWHQVFGALAPSLTLSDSRLRKSELFGAYRLASGFEQRQIFTQVEWQAAPDVVVRAGGEMEALASAIDGSIPATSADPRPGARTTVVSLDRTGRRTGAFAEIDWRPGERWRFIPGLRTDSSNLTRTRSFDPRLNAAFRLTPIATLTGAWGVYHQVPDPLFFDDSLGRPALPPIHDVQTVAGLQIGEEQVTFRIEAYEKRYRDLSQETRDYDRVVPGGRGTARGVDLFVKTPLVFGIEGRGTLSLLSARRTDPNTGSMARAPFDITMSRTLIVERALPAGVRLGVAYRSATGKPITPVIGATYDAQRDLYLPQYGAPMSERLPSFERVDLSFSQYRPIGRGWNGVFYLALSNLFDRVNVYDYRYSRDYAQRIPVRSIFNRSVYIGASLLRQ